MTSLLFGGKGLPPFGYHSQESIIWFKRLDSTTEPACCWSISTCPQITSPLASNQWLTKDEKPSMLFSITASALIWPQEGGTCTVVRSNCCIFVLGNLHEISALTRKVRDMNEEVHASLPSPPTEEGQQIWGLLEDPWRSTKLGTGPIWPLVFIFLFIFKAFLSSIAWISQHSNYQPSSSLNRWFSWF